MIRAMPLTWVPLAAALAAAGPQSAPPPASPAAYAIGPDDTVRVTVYGHEDLSPTVVVEPDGTFVFPLLGRLRAAGRTPRELEQELAARLGDGYVRSPQVAVVVQTHRSNVVYVVGEVARPGGLPLPEGRTLVEVLARAGPLTDRAGAEVVVLRPRAGAGAPGTTAGADGEVIRVDLALLQSGALENNLLLRPGDTVMVPRAPRVFVSGQVKKPGAYAIAPGTTVRQAIALAEGFAKRPRKAVRIVRQVDGRATQIEAGMDERLRDEDTVIVGPGS